MASRHMVEDAVAEWWVHPIATYQSSPYSRTAFGAIASDGKVLACGFDHGTGTTQRYEVGQATRDDHNVPALWVEDGHRTVIAWTNHGASPPDGGSSWDVFFKSGSVSGDLGSLVHAPEHTVSLGNASSYTQLHHISSRSDDTEDYFWCFTRRGGVEWCIRPLIVDQATGAISFPGDRIPLLVASGKELAYLSTADANVANGNQVIRAGFGYNPAESVHAIRYLEIDCVTGAISSPCDPGVSANVDGTHLPLADADINPILPEVAAGRSRRFFYTRPGPDTPAIAYCEWDTVDPTAAQYYVSALDSTEVGGLLPGAGYAQADHSAALDADANGFAYSVVITTPDTVPGNSLELGSRYTSGGWVLRLNADRTLTMAVDTNAAQVHSTTTAIPFAWGDTVGFGLMIEPGSGRADLRYSLDPLTASPTWHSAATVADTCTTVLIPAGTPLVIPTDDARFRGIPLVLRATYLDSTGAMLAGAEFSSDWTPGRATHTDSQGNAWSLVGNAAVVYPLTTYRLGSTGENFGYTDAANYVAGLAFPNPSRDQTVIRARGDGAIEVVDRLRLTEGDYVAETLKTQPTAEGRLIRPCVAVNGGPLAALVTNLRRYNGYTEFEGDVEGV